MWFFSDPDPVWRVLTSGTMLAAMVAIVLMAIVFTLDLLDAVRDPRPSVGDQDDSPSRVARVSGVRRAIARVGSPHVKE